MSDTRTSAYTTGVLHTHSGYAKGNIDKNFLSTLSSGANEANSKITSLMAKERELYTRFGEVTFEGFINKVRNFFNGADRQVIERFEAGKLSSSLSRFASQNAELLDQEVEIIIDTSKISNEKIKLGQNNQTISITTQFTPKLIKEFLNKEFKAGLIPSSPNTKKMDEFLDKIGEGLTIKVQKESGGSSQWTEYHRVRIPNYPWGITKNDIENAELDEGLKKDLIAALVKIKTFIFQELGAGGTPELKQAMQAVWSRNFSQSWSDPLRFFSGTTKSNFISAVQGSLGEFQAALIFEYLRGKKLAGPALAQIQGNLFQGGEQGKTDVQIFQSLGLQVKNVNIIEQNGRLSLLRDLKTNIHPKKFAQYLPNQGGDFLDFLANYYFNTSYQETQQATIDQLQKNLSYWLAELMNMALVDSEVGDTVSFYLISGRYLVPCSSIIRAASQLNLADSISITSSYKGKSDEDYASSTGDGKTAYEKYWSHKEEEWMPTGENYGTYHRLINKEISMRTHFNLIQEIERYALW